MTSNYRYLKRNVKHFFSYQGAMAWNQLSNQICEMNLARFKRAIS